MENTANPAKDEKGKKRFSLNKKISIAMIGVVLLTLFGVCAIVFSAMGALTSKLLDSSQKIGETAAEDSYSSMYEMTRTRLMELAAGRADLADDIFQNFQKSVVILAEEAELLYDSQDSYGEVSIPPPDVSNDGTLAVQLLYSAETDPEDPAIIAEAGLIGNMQDALYAVNDNSPNMVSDYIATETGIMMQADYISGAKFDSEGHILPYEAHERPWYIGVKATEKPFFTSVTKDAHTSRTGIICGAPIFHDGKLAGVAGAGMYLDNVEAIVTGMDLGENGDAFILNQEGKVLFSTSGTGTLAATVDGKDLRTSENPVLADLAENAVAGQAGMEALEIDGRACYVAYSPMETVGWSFFTILPREDVEKPAKDLTQTITSLTQQSVNEAVHLADGVQQKLILLVFLAVALALAVAVVLSRLIVRPIRKLTKAVANVQGDDLDFQWDMDTGDETQVLADSFRSLTERMKTYIENIQRITAERERIGAELNVAAQIQADMLPCIFPPFPDKKGIDIYAHMAPAKEVGGDFYDFFLLDDDHLALVMADVSGKGVPAALFMVISKTLIKDHAQITRSPKVILEKVNNILMENNAEEMFVTVWLGIMEISTGKITAANAGHEYPVVRGADGSFTLIKDKHGIVVGAMEDIKYRQYEMEIEPGGCLFLYTDGIPEATNEQEEMFGTGRMLDALNQDPNASPEKLLSNVMTSVNAFVGSASQFDDMTMLAMKREIENPDHNPDESD